MNSRRICELQALLSVETAKFLSCAFYRNGSRSVVADDGICLRWM